VAAGGALCVAAAGVFRWRLPALRVEARRMIVALQMAAGEPAEQPTGGAAPIAGREP